MSKVRSHLSAASGRATLAGFSRATSWPSCQYSGQKFTFKQPARVAAGKSALRPYPRDSGIFPLAEYLSRDGACTLEQEELDLELPAVDHLAPEERTMPPTQRPLLIGLSSSSPQPEKSLKTVLDIASPAIRAPS